MNESAVAQPNGAEETGAVAQPNVSDMDDSEFSGYIKNLREGNAVKKAENPTSEQVEEGKKEEPFKTFGTEQEFQQFMNKTIGDRLKKSKEAAEKYAEIKARAEAIYGSDEDAIGKMLDEAENVAAEEAGVSKEEYTRQKELERDANLYRISQEEKEKEAEAIHRQQEEWKKEEENLKAVIPDFDFMKAMENEDFRNAVLKDGLSLSAAYIRQTSNAVPQEKRQGVFEVGRGTQNGKTTGKVNPSDMSDSDFSSYIKKIKDRG